LNQIIVAAVAVVPVVAAYVSIAKPLQKVKYGLCILYEGFHSHN
jgi:hypothetical protein